MPGLHQGRSLEEHEALSLGVVLYKEDGVVLYESVSYPLRVKRLPDAVQSWCIHFTQADIHSVGIICERCEARGLSRCLSTDVRVLADGGLKFHSCSSCKAAQKGCSLYGQGLGIRHYAADQAAFSFRDSDERPDRVRTARSHRRNRRIATSRGRRLFVSHWRRRSGLGAISDGLRSSQRLGRTYNLHIAARAALVQRASRRAAPVPLRRTAAPKEQ